MLTPDEVKDLEKRITKLRIFAGNNIDAGSLKFYISDTQDMIDVLAWHDMVRDYPFLDELLDYYLDVYTWYRANMPQD
jgi:hypothetical protein